MWALGSEVVATAASFVATNIDNLLLLVTLLAASPVSRVAVAYTLSAVLVLAFAASGSFLGALVDPAALGYLGVLPLCLGLMRGCKAAQQALSAAVSSAGEVSAQQPSDSATGFVAIVLLITSNSGDTLAMFIPLFADTEPAVMMVLAAVYALLAALWLVLAIGLMRQPALTAWIGRQERWLLPGVLVTVGVFVLMDTDFDRLI